MPMGRRRMPKLEDKKVQKEIKIIQSPNGSNTIYFHMNYRMSLDFVCKADQQNRGQKPRALAGILLNIEGVQDIFIERYKVRVDKTEAIEWTEILPHVEQAIKSSIESAGGNLE